MFYSVDRIENHMAVLIDDNGQKSDIRLSCLPGSICEGTILIKEKDGTFRIDKSEEAGRKEEIKKLQEELFHNE